MKSKSQTDINEPSDKEATGSPTSLFLPERIPASYMKK